MKKKIIIFIVSMMMACTSSEKAPNKPIESFAAYELSGEVAGGVRVVEVDAVRYSYDPPVIVVNSGEVVEIRLDSLDAVHGFSVPDIDFNIFGAVAEGRFTAPVPGVYQIRCSIYCGSGHEKMTGTLVVK